MFNTTVFIPVNPTNIQDNLVVDSGGSKSYIKPVHKNRQHFIPLHNGLQVTLPNTSFMQRKY